MSPAINKGIRVVHRWIGLTIGLVIVMMALTGSVNLFRAPLEPVINRDLLTVETCAERVPLDVLAANARAVHAAAELDYVRIITGNDGAERMPATRIRFTDQEFVYLNPCTGAVLGQRERYGGVLGSIEQLHILRYREDRERSIITSVCAIIFVVFLIGGGIYMWWPRAGRSALAALKFDSRLKGQARRLNLHKTIGVYASLILVALVATALPLTFDWYRNGLYMLTGSALPAKPPASIMPAGGAPQLSMEAFWHEAQKQLPQPSDTLLHFPGKKSAAPLDGFMVARGAPHENARAMIDLDAYTGKVLRFTPYEASSLGHKLYFWTISFHTGTIGGFTGKLILLAGALSVPTMAYFGFASYLRRRFGKPAEAKMFSVRVNKITTEAADIKSFELVSINGSLPRFTPGAHINVKIEEGLVRQYSLCNGAEETDRYLIAVKRVPDSRGGAQTMHERVALGDVLSISAPRNHFPLQPRATHHLLVAGGIGVTPLIAMARELQSSGSSFEMQYFVRSIEHTAFHELLSGPEFCGKVTFHYALEPERLHEYLHKVLWRYRDGAHLYLCGPRPFMDLVEDIAAASWPPESIHIEHFGADPMASAGPCEAFDITLARSGGTYTVQADKSIAATLAENGIASVTSCEQGVCGTCLTGLLKGTPDHRDAFLTEGERKACDKIMVCVSRARGGGLVLDI